MSAAAHELAAAEHTRAAEQHADNYDPSAASTRLSCPPGVSARRSLNATVVEDRCWSSNDPNTAREILSRAERLRAAKPENKDAIRWEPDSLS